MALKAAIDSVKGRIEDLKTSIPQQRTKNKECATVVSQHRLGNSLFLGNCNFL